MAVKNFIGKLFFNATDVTAGISEVYPMIKEDYADASIALNVIAVARLALLSPDVKLAYAVVSDTDIRGDSQAVLAHVGEVGTFDAGTAPHVTREDRTGLLLRCSTADLTKRAERKLKYLPANVFNSTGIYTPYTEWTDLLDAFYAKLVLHVSVATNLHAGAPPYFLLTPYTGIEFERTTSFKDGRPFGIIPGRRAIR